MTANNNRLKAGRVLKGITQRQLADKVGLKEIDVSRIETGRVVPDLQMKRLIAEVLDKRTWELFEA